MVALIDVLHLGAYRQTIPYDTTAKLRHLQILMSSRYATETVLVKFRRHPYFMLDAATRSSQQNNTSTISRTYLALSTQLQSLVLPRPWHTHTHLPLHGRPLPGARRRRRRSSFRWRILSSSLWVLPRRCCDIDDDDVLAHAALYQASISESSST